MSKAFIYDLTPLELTEALNALEQPGFRTKQLLQGGSTTSSTRILTRLMLSRNLYVRP